MLKKILVGAATVGILTLPTISYADTAVGDSIVTLGENLTEDQKDTVLKELDPPKDAQTITVSNEEEHKYLDGVVPAAQIGTKALSSAMITYTESGSGIVVQTNNISAITPEMYSNALITAGLSDANISITAPFSVSGTAALTGIMKAYEVSSGEEINEDVQKVANEEMVTTAELGQDIGEEEAVSLVATVKEEIAAATPANTEELTTLIEDTATDMGISLSDTELQSLVSLFDKMMDLDIDWDQVSNQLSETKDAIEEFVNAESTQNFFGKMIDFFKKIVDGIMSLFQ